MSVSPNSPEIVPDLFFGQLYRWAWILMVLGAVILGIWGSLVLSLNFVAGTTLSVILIRITQNLVSRYIVPGEKLQQARQKLLLLLLVKIPVLVVVCGVIVLSPWFHPAGFMIGTGLIPVLIVILGGKMAFQAR